MAKCAKCGKSIIVGKKVQLKDAIVCGSCFKALSLNRVSYPEMYSFEEIKDGFDVLVQRNKAKKEAQVKAIVENGLKFANYGQKREVNATDGEAEMFDILCKIFPEVNFELCRKSDDYVTAMLGEWDVIRFKCSDRAKWVMFPVLEKPKKHYIDGPRYLEDYEASIKECVDFIKKAQS